MMPPESTVDEEAQKEAAEAVAKVGVFAAHAEDDNSIDGNPAYFGVEPERANHALDVEAPLVGEYDDDKNPEKLAFDAAQANAEEVAARRATNPVSTRTGYSLDGRHPTERRRVTADAVDQERAARAAAAAGGSAESKPADVEAKEAVVEKAPEATDTTPGGYGTPVEEPVGVVTPVGEKIEPPSNDDSGDDNDTE